MCFHSDSDREVINSASSSLCDEALSDAEITSISASRLITLSSGACLINRLTDDAVGQRRLKLAEQTRQEGRVTGKKIEVFHYLIARAHMPSGPRQVWNNTNSTCSTVWQIPL